MISGLMFVIKVNVIVFGIRVRVIVRLVSNLVLMWVVLSLVDWIGLMVLVCLVKVGFSFLMVKGLGLEGDCGECVLIFLSVFFYWICCDVVSVLVVG